MNNRRLVIDLTPDGQLAAALARVEAAERERDDANIEVALEQANAREAWERVAELEAQLVAQSAQGWRDFTERPPIGEQIQIATVIDAVREEPDGLYRIGHTSEWQTWRPAPQELTP